MPEIVDICKADDPRDVIHQAVQLLAQGETVIFPTETSFVVAAYALSETAVNRLQSMAEEIGTIDSFQFTLAFRSGVEAFDYFSKMSQLGHRLIRKKLPGSLIIEIDQQLTSGFFSQLPQQTIRLITNDKQIKITFPTHHIISSVATLLPAPLVIMQPAAFKEDQWNCLEDKELNSWLQKSKCFAIVDSLNQPSQQVTIVRVKGERCEIISEGSIDKQKLQRMTSENYLFVCTGNTCRSPMAEGLFRQKLAEILKCSPDELPSRGFNISSAGLAAMHGAPASPESVEIVNAHQGELNGHRSQPLTDLLLNESDWIYTMTNNHRNTILAVCPEASERIHLLAVNNGDISDPIGGGMSAYQRCEEEILAGIKQILQQIAQRQEKK